MKFSLIAIFFISFICSAQNTGFQVGGVGVFSNKNGSGYGGEFLATARLGPSVSLGAGAQAVSFNKYGKLYKPVFGTVKLNIPVHVMILNFDANLGYGFYKNQTATGGFYFASGLTLATIGKIGPYLSIHYSDYEFHAIKQQLPTTIKEAQNVNGWTLTAGFWLKRRTY